METRIGPIPIAEVRRIRDAVLRPDLPPGGSVYPGDDAPGTLHLGAFVDGAVAAVATMMPEAANVWRLRGMATLDAYQGLGLGRALGEACLDYARSQGAVMVWCSSRVSVAPFYRSLGFKEEGDHYLLPQWSDNDYVRMTRELR